MSARPGRRCTAVTLAALALLMTCGGCGRRVHLQRGGPDSTAAGRLDSLTARVREAQARWDAPDQGEDAARLTAGVLLDDLARRPPEAWERRARTLFDSLGIGAELSSGPCVLAANLFARSDPEGGAWPYLYWCGEKMPQVQPIEGRGLHLQALAGHGLEARSAGAASVMLLFARRSAGGQEPLLMVWSHARREDPWNLTQTLGPDSLGGVGTADLQAFSDTVTDLATRTYRPARGFDECTGCPHVYRTRRFRSGPTGFVKIEDQAVPSPYTTLVLFILALGAGDTEVAQRMVSDRSVLDQARRLDWAHPRGSWRVAPETDETAREMVLFRGRDEAYRVQFLSRGDDWLIAGIQQTTRTIE